MSKRLKANKAHKKSKKNNKIKTFNWARFTKKAAITLSVVGVIFASFYAYSMQIKVEHDLSVVGNGTPTLVQIHDPGCQFCNQLKKNVDKVKRDFKDDIQFKTANIKTNKGRIFADKYRVPHVTLLFFDGRGNRVNEIQGVTPPEDIQEALRVLARSR